MTVQDTIQRITYSAKEICAMLGISRSEFYSLTRRKFFTAIPAARRNKLYPYSQVLAFVARAEEKIKAENAKEKNQ
jgi:hypothetical protein